jgi:hypothetical protein
MGHVAKMRCSKTWLLVGLVSFAVACGGEVVTPVASPSSRPPPALVVVTNSEAQQPSAPNVPVPVATSAPAMPSAAVTEQTVNPMPPTPGVTELQPTEPTLAGQRSEAALLIDDAQRQASRLRTAWRDAPDAQRNAIASVIGDLESQSARVRQDVESLDVASSPGDAAHRRLDGDVGALRETLRASYAFAAPPTRGLPQPSPIPPSTLRP